MLGNKKNTMTRERYIPFRKQDVITLCEDLINWPDTENANQFDTFAKLLVSRIHYDYHNRLEHLKDNYALFDPNRDTRVIGQITHTDLQTSKQAFSSGFAELLDAANFEKVTDEDLREALNEESLFKVRLEVQFEDFEDVVFYRRGESVRTETLRQWWGLRKRKIEFTHYDRVAVYITFKDADYFNQNNRKSLTFTPGSTIVKLFQNVPKADLEMLFPNSEVRMRPLDKLIIGASAAVGGTVVLVTKLGASLILMASVVAFWLGLRDEEVTLTTQSLMTFGIGMGVFGSFVFKEWTKFKNRKIRFMKALSDNLYFKNLDNNAGVFHTLIDAAEEEDCKEALLAYSFLLNFGSAGISAEELDEKIEHWFMQQHQCVLDFDVADALNKLVRMNIISQSNDIFKAKPLREACAILDDYWDNIYQSA